ncbi:hypothetical protein LTR50_007906 [Elasticomyces elasticus]|nr:hypothetical protein LTR50_007906 [Elasticomyces elasticus]
MIEHADEVPTTYLNKGQKYSLVGSDTVPYFESLLRMSNSVSVQGNAGSFGKQVAAQTKLIKEGAGFKPLNTLAQTTPEGLMTSVNLE